MRPIWENSASNADPSALNQSGAGTSLCSRGCLGSRRSLGKRSNCKRMEIFASTRASGAPSRNAHRRQRRDDSLAGHEKQGGDHPECLHLYSADLERLQGHSRGLYRTRLVAQDIFERVR
jgi:hypothetical protein